MTQTVMSAQQMEKTARQVLQEQAETLWEVDVALPLESPQKERLWTLVEAKTQVWQKEVENWSG
jgi:hypothetical protein